MRILSIIGENKKAAGLTSAGILAGLGGMLLGVDPSPFITILGDTANNQIAQAGFFFTMAAWLHSGRVKKEIAKNFIGLTDAINNVASTLRQDLERQGKRLDNLTDRVENVEHQIKVK